MSRQSELVLDRTRRLLTYLAAVSRELTVDPVRDVTQHRDARTLTPAAVPVHSRVRLGSAGTDQPAWLTVAKVAAPAPPPLPAPLREQVDPASLRAGEVPRLLPAPADRAEPESERLAGQLQQWLARSWQPWLEGSRAARAARELYDALFALEQDTDRLKATHELVWGHSVLSWRVTGASVRYPLLITNVVIRLDQRDGTISVVPDGVPQVQLNPLEGLALPMIDELGAVRERLREQPPDPWDAVGMVAVHEQLIAPLGLDARVGTTGRAMTMDDETRDDDETRAAGEPHAAQTRAGEAEAGESAVVTDTWVLMLRPRPARHDRFYQQLAERLADGEVLPQALASVVADDDEVRAADGFTAPDENAWRAVGERLLLPLPANAEQERIVRQLSRDRGVTVQGPPGTGKSHTIANLISHLLAHGKRVLVTAQNEQALTVLRDKIPAELRELSIAVLGSSAESMEQLRGSAQAVMDIASDVDLDVDVPRVTALERDLDELRERLRRAELAVLAALSTEDAEFPLPAGPSRAPDVARWLSTHEDELGLIPDPLAADAVLPLTPQELRELFDLSSGISPADVAALETVRPDAGDLPTAVQLAGLTARLDQLRGQVDDLEAQGLAVETVDQATQEQLDQTQSYARNIAQHLLTLEDPWVLQVRASIAGSPELAQFWAEQSKQLTARVSGIGELNRRLTGHDVRLPAGDHRQQRELLTELHERFTGNRGLPRIGGSGLKQLHAGITVDGLPLHTAEEVELALVQVELGVETRYVLRLLAQLGEQVPIPQPRPGPAMRSELDAVARLLAAAVAWQTQGVPHVDAALRPFVPGFSRDPRAQDVGQVVQLLAAASRRRTERAFTAQHDALTAALEGGGGEPAASPLWILLRTALEQRDWPGWTALLAENARLTGLERPSIRRNELARRLGQVAPGWAGSIVGTQADPALAGRPQDAEQLWIWRQAATWLAGLLRQGDLTAVQAGVLRLQQEEQALVLRIARLGAAIGLKQNLKDSNRRALSSWLNALAKLGRGTGKYSAHWQGEARNFLPAAMGAVPVWIMPVHRVIENFDPSVAELFDVVIVDESSQCDLLSVGILALGAKAVVVGDDQQTSPAAVGVNRERIMQLQQTYLADVRESSLLTADESLYALSERIFPSTILLREHFRCVPEIIDFSNNRYYNGEILPLREPSRAAIGAPLQRVQVLDGACTGSASSAGKINRAEAVALVDQVVACHDDPAYDGLTFGVVTLLGSAQGPLIEGLLRERLGIDNVARRRLRVGSPAAFQGDERNVIFISLVSDDASWAATQRADGQRMNVAASRAQDQLWVFHTVEPGVLHGNDERRALIEYVRDAGSRELQHADLESRCESGFERDVLRELIDRGYEVQVQHRVGRYRIDLVVVGTDDRLAIECDGDRFHGPEQWEDDIRRQRQLERMGWTFWRIRASEFYRERPQTMAALVERLTELRITPPTADFHTETVVQETAEDHFTVAQDYPAIDIEPTESFFSTVDSDDPVTTDPELSDADPEDDSDQLGTSDRLGTSDQLGTNEAPPETCSDLPEVDPDPSEMDDDRLETDSDQPAGDFDRAAQPGPDAAEPGATVSEFGRSGPFDPTPVRSHGWSLEQLLTMFDLAPDFADPWDDSAAGDATPRRRSAGAKLTAADRAPRAALRFTATERSEPIESLDDEELADPDDVEDDVQGQIQDDVEGQIQDEAPDDDAVRGDLHRSEKVAAEPEEASEPAVSERATVTEPKTNGSHATASHGTASHGTGSSSTGSSSTGSGQVAPAVTVPDGYHPVGWIRPHEAEAVMNAYIDAKDVVVTDADGADSGLARFHPRQDPQALANDAQVLLSRRRGTGSWNVAWLRDYEAEAIITAFSMQGDLFFDDPDGGRNCLVQYFDPDSPEATAYRSSTRLYRRKPSEPEPARQSVMQGPGLTLRIRRAWVEAGDTAPALGWLERFTSSPIEMLRGQEMLSLVFEGYSDAQHELPEVTAIREYVRALDRTFPFWLFFLSKASGSLAVLLRCMLPTPAGTEDFRTSLAAGLGNRWFPAMKEMAHRAELEPAEIDAMTDRMLDYVVPARQ